MQLAQSYAMLAADGVHRPVTLLRRDALVPGERVVSQDIAHALVKMLGTVTTDAGTAARARINGYSVAGKTGTAHKLSGAGYSEDEYLSLFAGMAPASRPRVVTVVVTVPVRLLVLLGVNSPLATVRDVVKMFRD